MQPLEVLHFTAGAWVLEAKTGDHLNQIVSSYEYILIEEDVYTVDTTPAPELVTAFQIPSHLLTHVYRRSNGFFGFEESFDGNGKLQSHNTWFRFLVKMTARDSKSSYTWHEMTFFSRWTPNGCRMLCIGVPSLFRTLLQDSLSRMVMLQPPTEPYSLHVPVLEAIVAMQDLSLWSMRDIVRGIEKTRALALRGPEAFLPMHEGARHAIHAFEVLSVSVQTGEALQQNLAQLRPDPRSRRSSALVPHVAFQLQMLRNLLSRSQSNKERLQNEVAQAHNMIAQRDSQTMTKLGEAAKRDSGAMRTVAVVTMAFLPPTFLSAIFSMSFFNYTPPPTISGWSVSSSVWIYFLCAVPLTLATLGVWFWGAWVGRWVRRAAGGKA